VKSDRERWNFRYSGTLEEIPPPDQLLVESEPLLKSGRALDLACGLGSNALFLAKRGYWVDALDTSMRALRRLQKEIRERNLTIGPVLTDLDYYPVRSGFYDLVIIFYFFSKGLMRRIISSLKPGGLLIYATFNYRHLNLHPGFRHDYLVPEEGLAQFFPNLETVMSAENSGEQGNVSQFIGRKISCINP
jgi:tellurite methyltransferase